MKTLLRTCPALACALVIASGCGKSDQSGFVGKPAPDVALSPVHPAGDTRLSAYKGKVVLLDFWATWCGPCRMLMPHLQMLQNKYKAKGFAVVGISDETRETVLNFSQQHVDLNYDMFLDPKSDAALKYHADHLPTTVVVGKDGKIEYYEVGFDDDSLKDLDSRVDQLVNG